MPPVTLENIASPTSSAQPTPKQASAELAKLTAAFAALSIGVSGCAVHSVSSTSEHISVTPAGTEITLQHHDGAKVRGILNVNGSTETTTQVVIPNTLDGAHGAIQGILQNGCSKEMLSVLRHLWGPNQYTARATWTALLADPKLAGSLDGDVVTFSSPESSHSVPPMATLTFLDDKERILSSLINRFLDRHPEIGGKEGLSALGTSEIFKTSDDRAYAFRMDLPPSKDGIFTRHYVLYRLERAAEVTLRAGSLTELNALDAMLTKRQVSEVTTNNDNRPDLTRTGLR